MTVYSNSFGIMLYNIVWNKKLLEKYFNPKCAAVTFINDFLLQQKFKRTDKKYLKQHRKMDT